MTDFLKSFALFGAHQCHVAKIRIRILLYIMNNNSFSNVIDSILVITFVFKHIVQGSTPTDDEFS